MHWDFCSFFTAMLYIFVIYWNVFWENANFWCVEHQNIKFIWFFTMNIFCIFWNPEIPTAIKFYFLEWNEKNKQKNSRKPGLSWVFLIESGSYLSSRAVASQVLSAYKSLTSVFGMGTGVPLSYRHRKIRLAPPVGLEPTTFRLTAERSTSWAKEEYIYKYIVFLFSCQPP